MREGRCYIYLVHGVLQGQSTVNELMTLRVFKKKKRYFLINVATLSFSGRNLLHEVN